MATVPKYTIRQATREDVKAVEAMSDREGFEVITELYYTSFDADPRGWYVAESEDKEILGVRALAYINPTLTAGGMYIVKKELRGLKIGRYVNKAAMEAIGDSPMVLQATNVNLYSPQGFIVDYDFSEKRMNIGQLYDALPCETSEMTLTPLSDNMVSMLLNYDYEVAKHDRSKFVRTWMVEFTEKVFVALNANDAITGYGCLRNSEYSYQATPVYADSPQIAMALMRVLLENVDRSEDISLITNERNESMCKLVARVPHRNIEHLHKMYRGPKPDSNLAKVFSMSALSFCAI